MQFQLPGTVISKVKRPSAISKHATIASGILGKEAVAGYRYFERLSDTIDAR